MKEDMEDEGSPQGAKTKEAANYRISESADRCAQCMNFSAPDACSLVGGEISQDAVCDFFSTAANPVEMNLFSGMLPNAIK